MTAHALLREVEVLEEQLVDLRRQRLLEDPEEGVGLAADGHGEGEVLHAVLDVALREELLAELDLERDGGFAGGLVGSWEDVLRK